MSAAFKAIDVLPTRAAAVTPNDDTVFDEPRTIYVGVTGDVAVVPYNSNSAVTYKDVPVGAVLPVAVKKVLNTGTTASSLVAQW